MQRAIQRGDEATEGLDRERHSLLEQLRTAEQVGCSSGCIMDAQCTRFTAGRPHVASCSAIVELGMRC